MRARPHRISLPLSVAVAALLAGVAAACSLTTSLDGFSSGAVGDTFVVEGGTDAATTPPEAGTDAAPRTDSGDGETTTPPFRCADYPSAVFCADFDDGAFNAGWAKTYLRNGGTLALGAGRSRTGLVATVPTRSNPTASTRPVADLEMGVALSVRQPLTVAFDMLREAGGGGGGVIDIGGIGFHAPFYIVTFRVENEGAVHLHEYGDPLVSGGPSLSTDFPLGVQAAIGTWVHVTVQLTFPKATEAHLLVTFDGATAYDGAIGASPYASTPFVSAGVNNAESAGQARTVDFDDVLVTTP